MNVQAVESTKGRSLYRANGFLYELEEKILEKLYCRCVQKRWRNCGARSILCKAPEPTIVRLSGAHNHEPDDEKFLRLSAVAKMKKVVVDQPDRGVKEVYAESLISVVSELRDDFNDEEIGLSVPIFASVRRKRGSIRPRLPMSRSDIELDDVWTKTLDGEPFLLIDDGGEDRILGFSTREMIFALCEAETVFMDGTFRVVPELFLQLYSLHAFYRGQMVPLAFFLLPDKRKDTYRRMFVLLKNYAASIGRSFDPRSFRLDFETAVVRVIDEMFPSAEAKGCLFHFGQALWRKAQALGLSCFNEDAEVKRFLRCVKAMALVPVIHLDDVWLEINAQSPEITHPAYPAVERFKEYFIHTWLQNETIFPRSLWNHYRNFGARTTNHLEAWHRGLNALIRKMHVNVFQMVKRLQHQERKYKILMLQLRMGQAPSPPTKKYQNLHENLMKFVDQNESSEISLMQYVTAVAFNLHADSPTSSGS
ncbi:uncharacterized protein LOC108864276 [Galendromus occidentalis]|uniref:Uncharacterized protein LOC108864276 n=1 Tax=Galendromus occidentalis TaxID=34638 RepID=A0AAJ7L6M2_9ACAR|nr:uncharacterized protein LOC108865186 [Galendromus occidentalis]XP_028967332.1 uncharacterized protein LOC108864276 [Galendromus occidentalis]